MTTNNTATEAKTFSLAEAALELGMEQDEVERVIHEGKLAAQIVDGNVQIAKKDLDDFRDAYFSPPGASF